MKTTVTPNAEKVVTYGQVAIRLGYTNIAKRDDIDSMIASAQSFAEQELNATLLTSTATATAYDNEKIYLNKGPVQAIVSVTLDGIPNTSWQLKTYGTLDELIINSGYRVATIVYTVGYGDSNLAVPQTIVDCIMAHTIERFKNPGVIDEKTLTQLRNFYRLNSRHTVVG